MAVASGAGLGAKKPQRLGTEDGQTVRSDGYVWEWQIQEDGTGHWRRVRAVTKKDRDKIPHWTDAIPTHAETSDEAESANKPNRPGTEQDQLVRNGGWVWVWDGDEWSPLHKVTASDRENIPAAAEALDAEPDLTADVTAEDIPAEDPDDLQNIPGGARLWKVDGDHFLAYEIPGTDDDPVWLVYRIRGEGQLSDITADGAVRPDRVMDDFGDRNIIRAGESRELQNIAEHPWDGWLARYNEAAGANPMLRDDEVLALFAASWLETGSAPSTEALEQTEWWQERTDTERLAIRRYGTGTDTAQFAEDFASNRAQVESDLIAAGFDFTDANRDRILNHLASQVTWGHLTADEYTRTVERLSNPYAVGADPTAGYDDLPPGAKAVRYKGRTYIRVGGRDWALAHGWETAKYGADAKRVDRVNEAGAFRDYLASTGKPQGGDSVEGVERVRQMILRYAGPVALQGWSQSQIAAKAQQIADNPAVEEQLVRELRAAGRAAYGEAYQDGSDYESTAALARGLFTRTLGINPDEADPFFVDLVRVNDAAQMSARLRDKGLREGIGTVRDDFAAQAAAFTNGGVVRSVV